jgi:hypothetical protein
VSARQLLLIIAMSLGAADLRAQTELAQYIVGVGARVRVDVVDSVTRVPRVLPARRVIGTIRAIAPETLYLDLDSAAPSGAVAVPRIRIQSLERSLGPPSRWESATRTGLSAVLLGFLVGNGLGERGDVFASKTEGRLLGVGVGLACGVVYGLVRPYERWRFALLPE